MAAEGFLGGDLDGVCYGLKVRFLDPWRRPVGEFQTPEVRSNGVPKSWQEVTLEGEVPEDGYLAEFRFHFVADGGGHHAVALNRAWLRFEEKGGN